MIGKGTIINVIAIMVGAGGGLLLKNGIPERMKQTIMQGIGLAVVMLGLSGALQELFQITAAGGLERRFTMLMICCLVVGGMIGTGFRIEERLERLGKRLERKFSRLGGNFARGFITASLVYCVGAMAVVGALEDGLTGKIEILLSKSILDGISAVIFGASLGPGVLFSAVSVFLYQGTLTILAGLVKTAMSPEVLSQMSLLGGILIMAIGFNLLEIGKIKVGDFLPAIFLPLLFELVQKGLRVLG
ncbi:MAG TPA: DUF554 domain-containing protein [Firmicutes bacterium]|uniref:DUF554 domain-containing protein n=1 Tax=Capillibacterium thermochitinicola TaxID=2699427 RepID=A0A8J6HZV0_9FIRM|nr:DUF554 domain-containing protein [Capillibacterium thermochitinicola]MBA2133120.1 DUF554 domain-containing protein [Capillibacterium thermochitinicola]HHW11960.1 DUF554 domain-containing protein [Bacillota bacterium]